MICQRIELTMNTLEPRDIAKAMLKFWLFQHEQARQHYTAASLKIEHAQRANEEARQRWQKSDELGFGPHLPFKETYILSLVNRLPALKKNLEEANAMLGYIINFITDKAHSKDD